MGHEAYDQIPYPAAAFGETHPANLQTVATIFGLTPPDARSARVLELGCATGGNIVPMAVGLPGAQFVGIDYAARQIELARAFARDAGAPLNLELRTMSILDITRDFGTFDYIIAHGIYSWVPADVREHTLRVCRDNLSEHGVAYVSLNVLPGWYSRKWLRDFLLTQIRKRDGESVEQLASRTRGAIDVLFDSPRLKASPMGAALKAAFAEASSNDDAYMLHDLLETDSHPFYFRDFAEQATASGLQYLADAHSFGSVIEEAASPRLKQLIDSAGDDLVQREQTLDFIRNNTFRRALLVHRERRIDRENPASRILPLYASAALRCSGAGESITNGDLVSFDDGAGNGMSTNLPAVKQALRALSPLPARIGDLVRSDDALALQQLLSAWMMRLIRLSAAPPPHATTIPHKPCISPVARYEMAHHRRALTNLRHEAVPIDPTDIALRDLLGLIDGRRTTAELCATQYAAIVQPVLQQVLLQGLLMP